MPSRFCRLHCSQLASLQLGPPHFSVPAECTLTSPATLRLLFRSFLLPCSPLLLGTRTPSSCASVHGRGPESCEKWLPRSVLFLQLINSFLLIMFLFPFQKWLPIFDQHHVAISTECPFHLDRDYLWWPNDHKEGDGDKVDSHWTCPVCSRDFLCSESLTLHWDEVHREEHTDKYVRFFNFKQPTYKSSSFLLERRCSMSCRILWHIPMWRAYWP